jgi:hypothetical protein
MQRASIPPWRPAAEKRTGHNTPRGNSSRAQGMIVAAPAKTVLLYFASNEPDKWVAKIGIAQSITDAIQAQCHSNR